MNRHERAPISEEEKAEKRRAYKREWQRKDRLKNPEKYKGYNKAAQATDKRKAYKAEWQRKWRDENREQTIAATRNWQKNNPDQNRESQRNWMKANPEKGAEYRKAHAAARAADDIARRRQREKATPQWADIKAMQAVYDLRDRLTEETGVQHHVDHIIPLRGKTVSGLHNQFNLQVITAAENLAKGNKLVDDIV